MTKIAFWRTIGDSYRFFFAHWRGFAMLAAPWLLGLVAALVLALILLRVSLVLAGLVGAAGAVLFYGGGTMAIAVAWHRAILLDETPRFAWRFGKREWRFLGYSLLIALMIGGGVLVGELLSGLFAGAMTALLGRAGAVFFVLPVAVALSAWFFGVRLTLALPAVAVDEAGDRLSTAWQRGRGNGLRLFFGSFVCMIPIFIAQLFVQIVFRLAFGPAALVMMRHGASGPASLAASALALNAIMLVIFLAQLAVTVGFLSFSYRQLAGTGPAPESDAALPAPAQ